MPLYSAIKRFEILALPRFSVNKMKFWSHSATMQDLETALLMVEVNRVR